MRKYLKLIRVHHYIKNLLVFAALVCSGQLFNLKKFISCLLSFLAFCMISSVVYIINDLRDKEKDKLHPTKCKRPLASGDISVKNAVILAIILFCGAMACNLMVFHVVSSIFLILYFVLNLAYSLGLKNIPILDVTILVSGFLLRIVYGAYISDIVVSDWLYLTVAVLAFYFSFGKRRNEAKQVDSSGNTRTVLKHYPAEFLNKYMNMCLSLSIAFYALWSVDEKTVTAYNTQYLVLTVPIVLLITMKYGLDIEKDYDGDPVEVLLKDKLLLVLCVSYLAIMFIILYLL